MMKTLYIFSVLIGARYHAVPTFPESMNKILTSEHSSCFVFSLFTFFKWKWNFICYVMYYFNRNDWEQFEPHTNALWLHYLADKMLKRKKYPNKDKDMEAKLKRFLRQARKCCSATEIVQEFFDWSLLQHAIIQCSSNRESSFLPLPFVDFGTDCFVDSLSHSKRHWFNSNLQTLWNIFISYFRICIVCFIVHEDAASLRLSFVLVSKNKTM